MTGLRLSWGSPGNPTVITFDTDTLGNAIPPAR
jgi:hypothetical protein